MSLPSSKEAAIREGLNKYFTGKPCKHGHISARYVISNVCLTCQNLDTSKRIAGNRAAQSKRCADWAKRNPDRIRDAKRRYAASEHGKIKIRQWTRNRRYAKRASVDQYTSQDIVDLFTLQNGRCACCFRKLTKYEIDHIIPISKGGGNGKDNIQILCPTCNRKKWNKMPAEFAFENGRLL